MTQTSSSFCTQTHAYTQDDDDDDDDDDGDDDDDDDDGDDDDDDDDFEFIAAVLASPDYRTCVQICLDIENPSLLQLLFCLRLCDGVHPVPEASGDGMMIL